MTHDDDVDFALAVYHEGGSWQVQELTHHHLVDVETLSGALRRLPGDFGAVGMVAIDEDFFVLVRVAGESTRVLLSDVTAADDWELAGSAVDFLGVAMPEDDGAQVPAGDLALLADLGMPAGELGELLDDDELYPDEILSDIADRLGFGELFDDAVGLTNA
ncbi:MAG: tRNA adenosine deaminase-associated protein [Nocardioides sp.]|nr:tRNA adenosine deaminase-associated protein [Nocardioides sp.]